MNKKEALHAMIDGKKVARPGWSSGGYYHFDGEHFIGRTGGEIPVDEMSRDGYIIYEDPEQIEKIEVVYFVHNHGDTRSVRKGSTEHDRLAASSYHTEVTI